ASAQEVRLVRCTVAGEIADVTAASGSGPFTAEIRSRAGPPDPPVLTFAPPPPAVPTPGPPQAALGSW
ncbi:hypothetical protein GTY41_41855, partial [Streptomyces sp. SID685]|nr:hypothetical protein [Streptomyces sp. SID685]